MNGKNLISEKKRLRSEIVSEHQRQKLIRDKRGITFVSAFIGSVIDLYRKDPREVVKDCIEMECSLEDMKQVLYLYEKNFDPFLTREMFEEYIVFHALPELMEEFGLIYNKLCFQENEILIRETMEAEGL